MSCWGRASLLVVLAGCRQILGLSDLPDAGDATVLPPDADGDIVTIVDDDPTQLGAGTLDGAALDPVGLVGPRAYASGLHVVAYQARLVGDTTTWLGVQQAAAVATSTGAAYGAMPTDWTTGRPSGLGLNNGDNWSLLYDGEIHLAAGAHTFIVSVDDYALVEIDPGTGFATAAGGVTVAADGWYPIHAAFTDTGGSAHLTILVDGAGLDKSRLRARTDTASGVLATVYNTQFSDAPGAVDVAVPAVDHDYGTDATPFDAALTGTVYFMRLAGQVHVDTPGDYAIATTATGANDSVRVWLDRGFVGAAGQTHLDAGWHGLLVDFTCSQATSHDAQLGLQIGGHAIATSALRPVATTRPLVTVTSSGGLIPLADAPATTALPLVGTVTSAGAITDGIRIGWALLAGVDTDYTAVANLGGAVVPMPLLDVSGVSDLQDDHARGQPIPTTSGVWSVQVTDHVAGNTGSGLALASVTAHGGAGAPFVPTWTYTSAQHPTPDAVALGAITLGAALDGATAKLEVRTSTDDSAWVVVASGAAPTAPVGTFVQYRITVTGDGWQFPTIDRVAIDYVVPR